MTSVLKKQIKYHLRKSGFCVVPKTNITLTEANNFAAVNHLFLFVDYTNNYVFHINKVQQQFKQAEKREQWMQVGQHILFTVLATFFFLILWLDLFQS